MMSKPEKRKSLYSQFRISKWLVAALAMSALPALASNCTLSDWPQPQGNITAGSPDDKPTVIRYSGSCGIRADSVPSYVTDTNPNAERSYYSRFYYYTGDRIGGSADIFQARKGTSASNLPIRVQHDGASLSFSANSSGSAITQTVTVTDNRWYAIELGWKASPTASPASGSLTITVTGNGSDVPLNTPMIGNLNNVNDQIDEVHLGLISGAGAGVVYFDAFDSLRDQPPGRLCRGDAVPDGVRNVLDVGAIIDEVNANSLSAGQPDVNEDGHFNVLDLGALVALINDPALSLCP